MTASQMRIAETIDAFYGDAGTRDGVSRSYKQAVEDLDAETIKALDGPYRYPYLHFAHGFPLEMQHILTFLPSEQLYWNQFRVSVPTFLTSTNVSRSETTSSWTMMQCVPK